MECVCQGPGSCSMRCSRVGVAAGGHVGGFGYGVNRSSTEPPILFESWLENLITACAGRTHRKGTRRRPRQPLARQLETLEDRSLLSISFNPTSGALNIVGTSAADTAEVSSPSAGVLRASLTTASETETQDFTLADVNLVVFTGADGNDEFTNLSGVSANASGNGGSGPDTLKGDSGDDLVSGSLGNDSLKGGTGNDVLLGGAGDDELQGESDDDQLSGKSGNDTIEGGSGIPGRCHE